MKKTNLTNVEYQKKFLPLLNKASVEIKKLIQFYAFHFKNKNELREKIKVILRETDKRLPNDLFDRKKYLLGLYYASEKMIRDFYDTIISRYFLMLLVLSMIGRKDKPKTPLEMVAYENKNKESIFRELKNLPVETQRDLWSKAKGVPNVTNYEKLVELKIKELAETPIVSAESGKKPISIWQKAELDVRHEHQMKMIDDLKNSGVRYAWTSSHPDCSKRCEKWQGKLFDLEAQHSELSGHRMKKKLDGKTVYCFNEVISKIDKYGYTNNIIVGFNCRHKLIPYAGQLPPEHYDKEEVEKERAINEKLRYMERQIRLYKEKALLYNKTNPAKAKYYREKVKKLIAEYREFAEKNGFTAEMWRL